MVGSLGFLGLLLVGGEVWAAKPGWSEDFDAAKAKAAAEKKHVLLDFTGSDWCGYCIKMDKDVFAKPDFQEFGAKNLVLVELDFPRGKSLSAKVKAQNESLERQFRVEGYPTLVLLDPQGKEVKRWVGYDAALVDKLKKTVGRP